MVDTKPVDLVVKKWSDAIGRVPQAYSEGIRATTGFKEKALEGQALYEQKMSDPSVLARRARGLEEISDEDWKRGAIDKGAARIGPGMSASKGKFQSGISEVLNVIRSVNLPPRAATGRENVLNRVLPIVEALEGMKK